jgi:flagellar M-ring protein FliF
MAKISDLLTQFLTSPAKGRNLSIVVILLLSVIGFGSLIFWNSQPDYQILFSNLSQEDAGEMVSKLKEKKIPFQLSQSGTTLSVPRDQVYDLRLSLAAEGLPKGGGVGFEVFDRTNLGVTDFVQKLNYQRALQGELSRTIKQIKEIEQARVHVVTPKESLFVEEQKKPTASVLIKTRSNMALSPSQVEGIVHLVSSAVEGLDPENITVVDTSGKMLSKKTDSSPMSRLTTTQLEYQRNLEEGLKKKVQGMLEEVLGPNKGIARVSMDIDFQQVDITEERYDPTTILRSEQRNRERSSATSAAALTGETKIENPSDAKLPKGNVTPESPAKPSVSPRPPLNTSSSERQHEVRNYEISRINKHVKNPVGQVKKVSAAVIVDGIYKEGTDAKGNKAKQYTPRSQEEMKNLETLVKKAIGYSEERGDQVEVINMPFYGSTAEEDTHVDVEQGSPWWREYLMMAYKPAVSLILALLFLLFVIRPLMKKRPLTEEGETPLLQAAPSSTMPSETQREIAKEMHPSTPLRLKEQTVKLIQEDPSRTVGIVKSWLNEGE